MWVHEASAEETGMPHARSIIRAQTQDLKEPGSEPTERYFVSSLSPSEVSAQRYYQLVRGHWNIEPERSGDRQPQAARRVSVANQNGTNWQRDTLWREDAHQMRGHQRAHVLSSLRQVVLHLHSMSNIRAEKPTPISHRARQALLKISRSIGQITRNP